MKHALVIFLLLATACKKEEPAKTAPVVARVERASVATVATRYVSSGPRLSGTLQPQSSATIVAETAGTVVNVLVAEGQAVSRGTVLARIEDAAASAGLQAAQVALQSAQTAVAVAQRDSGRTERLSSAGALPKRDAEVARAQAAGAQAQLALARSQLATANERVGNQTIVASTSGVISLKNVSQGDVVAPGAPLFTIVDLSSLQLEATVPADAIGQINPGSPVQLEVRGYKEQAFQGTVSRIAPSVDPSTGQVRVYVSLNNQGRKLVSGLFAEGTVTAFSRQGLAIPVDALDESSSTPRVMRIRNGVTEQVTVKLGIRNESEGFVEVLSGLSAGDVVLVGPARTMLPGSRVTVV